LIVVEFRSIYRLAKFTKNGSANDLMWGGLREVPVEGDGEIPMDDPKNKPLPAPQGDSDRKLLADVQGHGWHVIGVETDEEEPGFAYSIGLYHTFRHPEIIVFGLSRGEVLAVPGGKNRASSPLSR